MTTKDKFIQLSVIHSTKRENQTIIGLPIEGRLFKRVALHPNYRKIETIMFGMK